MDNSCTSGDEGDLKSTRTDGDSDGHRRRLRPLPPLPEANWPMFVGKYDCDSRTEDGLGFKKETFSKSLTPRKPTGGSRSSGLAETRGLSLATVLPNTSRWMPKGELNAGFTVYISYHIISYHLSASCTKAH